MVVNAVPAPDEPRDAELDRLYRAAGGLEPGADLDRVILAAAHREVRAGPQAARTALLRWSMPLALAAVVVLSVTVVTLVAEHGDEELPPPSPMPQAEPAASEPPVAATAPRERRELPMTAVPSPPDERVLREDAATPATRSKGRTREQQPGSLEGGSPGQPTTMAPLRKGPTPGATPEGEGQARRQELARRPAPGSVRGPVGGLQDRLDQSAPSPAKTQDDSVTGARSMPQRSDRLEAVPAAPSAAMKPAAGSDSAPTAGGLRSSAAEAQVQAARKPAVESDVNRLIKELEGLQPELWLARIEALRREGRRDEADGLTEEFAKRFPYYPGIGK